MSDGETESVYAVFTVNQNLIKTGIFVDGVGVDSKYLTAGQIGDVKEFRNFGSLRRKAGNTRSFCTMGYG